MPRPLATDKDPLTPRRSRALGSSRTRRIVFACAVLFALSPALLSLATSFESIAQVLFARFGTSQPLVGVEEITPAPPATAVPRAFTFESSALHPDRLYRHYFRAPIDGNDTTDATARLIQPFRDLLSLYIMRQGEDDNFTVRVLDSRDWRTLEIFTLSDERDAFHRTGDLDWLAVDRLRRVETRRLVDKYVQLGIPKEDVAVRWGRADQVRMAREREAPYIAYEVRLANYLGLSLLVTEIGTVETFNDDRLVSPVGARGRYQMMPYNLRKYGIEHYELQTAYGSPVKVVEEWHPMLTMEPAFKLLRGYVNAVGHEIPGISAYHTGPGNLFKIYKMFLTDHTEMLSSHTSVVDAFVWALTDGFDQVSTTTNFKNHSRGYVPSGYGSLRAVETLPIDSTRTFQAERVQLKPDRTIFLSQLLEVLEQNNRSLDWGPATDSLVLYERFRRLNPHVDLPPADSSGAVPPRGDLRLVAATKGTPVRFFLPLHAAESLAAAGVEVLDGTQTRRYDDDLYRLAPGERTVWDRQYDDLVASIQRFGFTHDNRETLNTLAATFETLAAEHPTPYRLMQRDIIRIHRQLWDFAGWEELATVAEAASGLLELPARPPYPIDLKPLPIRPPAPGD